jgi:hypothetical protein
MKSDLKVRLQKEFPGHIIEFTHLPTDIGNDCCSVIYDGNLMRIKFCDFTDKFKKDYNLDIREQTINDFITQLKLELSRLPKKL